MQSLLLVFIGGGIGSLSRFGISQLYIQKFQENSPVVATVLTNILASAILALTWVLISKGKLPENMKYFVLVGFCGGFSTFSTFSFETLQMLRSGMILPAVLNVLASVTICLLVMYLIVKDTAI